MVARRDIAATDVHRVVEIPCPKRMWMPPREADGLVIQSRVCANRSDLVDLQEAKNPVMAVAPVWSGKEAEEQKYVADNDVVV
jgi:hypothetical protein